MNKKLGFNDFQKSQFAIRDYINYREKHSHIHEAIVIISSNGKKLFNDVIRVEASIDTNNSFVQFVGNEQFERDFYIKYTNEYQKFMFTNGCLRIMAEDRWGNAIEIDISGL